MRDEARAIMADIYLTDYCIWLQTCSEGAFESLATALAGFRVAKEDVDLNLLAYDEMRAAILAEEEGAVTGEGNESDDSDDNSDDNSDDSDDNSDDNSQEAAASTTSAPLAQLELDASSLPAHLVAQLKL